VGGVGAGGSGGWVAGLGARTGEAVGWVEHEVDPGLANEDAEDLGTDGIGDDPEVDGGAGGVRRGNARISAEIRGGSSVAGESGGDCVVFSGEKYGKDDSSNVTCREMITRRVSRSRHL
jgi:hypothetical protein